MNTTDFLGTKNSPVTELPVFVDDSGRKQRAMRRIGYVAGILCATFLGVVGVGLATENVGPSASTSSSSTAPFALPSAEIGQQAAAAQPAPKPVAVVRPQVVAAPKPKPATPPAAKCTTGGTTSSATTDVCPPKPGTGTESPTDTTTDPGTTPETDTGTAPPAPPAGDAGQPTTPEN